MVDITHHKCLDAKLHPKGFKSLDKFLNEEQRAWMSSPMIWFHQKFEITSTGATI